MTILSSYKRGTDALKVFRFIEALLKDNSASRSCYLRVQSLGLIAKSSSKIKENEGITSKNLSFYCRAG